jgi:signal transduction histidine kinase/ActR/RegA family two-component response regulator
MQIRTYLFLMAVGILIPVITFSGLALTMLQNAEKTAALRGMGETARGVALLIDRELYSAEAALRVLGSSPSLAGGDLRAFYQQATTANRGPGGWSLLLDRQGRQVINTILPFGAELPLNDAGGRVRQVMASGRTLVSSVIDGPASKRLVTTVNVPVRLDAGQRYVLAMAFSTDHFNQLIAGAGVPPGLLVAIIDANGRFIARSLNSEKLVGRQARPVLVDAARLAQHGEIRHLTLEGTESFGVFTHSSLSGWTITVAAPVDSIERSARHASLVAALGLLAAIGCAGVLAAFFGRLHVRSIRRAVAAARELGKGIPPAAVHSRVLEVNELHAALHVAGRQLVHAQSYRKNAELERQALLEREQKARVMAEQQNIAKDQFLAMLGHELRNPLAPISTAAQLLRLPALDADRVRYASDVISRQVEHMSRLLGDLLDVARVTRGLVSLTLERIDLNAVIERALEQTRGLIDAKHHKLELHLPPGPVPIRADPTRLIQVFANLLNNAAKYTPPHGLLSLTVAPAGDQVLVTVRDDGEGIAPDLLPRIFDLFSQGERTPDRSQGGLGLGLALVKSLVHLHGGTVTAASAGPDQGSCFAVALPCRAAPDSVPPVPSQAPAAGAAPLCVMLVDDNVDGANSLSLYLETAGGHHVCTCYDGAEALARSAAEQPEVFILDIGLPDMTGYQLAQQLRARFPDATMIALTGYGQPQDKARAAEAGFDLHVAKPAEPGQILELLARCAVHAAAPTPIYDI